MVARKIIIGACYVLLSSSGLYAQSAPAIPDAGSVFRLEQMQRERQNLLPADSDKEPAEPVPAKGVRIKVKRFTFHGYEGIADEQELQEVVADAIGRQLTFKELQTKADKVSAYLRQQGWFLARAYLPGQDITEGLLDIVITNGKSDGKISITRDASVRISEQTLEGIAELAVRPGEALNKNSIERSLLLMNDLPSVTAKATVLPGTEPGSSTIDLSVTEGSLVSGMAWVDNHADHYSGSWRGNTMLFINDPFRYGDQFSLTLNAASGLGNARIGYNFPLNHDGLRGNLSCTRMSYEPGGELADLQYKGDIMSADAGLSYPVLRSRNDNISTSISGNFKTIKESKAGQQLNDKQLQSGTVSLYGDFHDQYFGGSHSLWNLSVTLGNMHESLADNSRTGTEGTWSKLNFSWVRSQRLSGRFDFSLSAYAQKSFNNLDSSEKFSLGGINGVRAYPVGEGAGDSGSIINADLHYTIPTGSGKGMIQINGFFDAGYIFITTDPTFIPSSSSTLPNDYWLKGAGLGIYYTSPGKYTLRGSWAQAIGDNPWQTITGNNADGHNDKSRFWLQGLLFF